MIHYDLLLDRSLRPDLDMGICTSADSCNLDYLDLERESDLERDLSLDLESLLRRLLLGLDLERDLNTVFIVDKCTVTYLDLERDLSRPPPLPSSASLILSCNVIKKPAQQTARSLS